MRGTTFILHKNGTPVVRTMLGERREETRHRRPTHKRHQECESIAVAATTLERADTVATFNAFDLVAQPGCARLCLSSLW
jgi:hypothetical protein